MKKIVEGQAAPDFSVTDIDGKTHELGDYRGSYLLLTFYRFASCPLCNLRVSQVIKRKAEFEARGMSFLAVFHSPEEAIRRYVGRQGVPFPLIPDPRRELFRTYDVLEISWLKFLKAFVFRIGAVLKAYMKGFFVGSAEGGLAGMPADFLIGPDGNVISAYYGRDAGDHLPFKTIEQILPHPAAADASS